MEKRYFMIRAMDSKPEEFNVFFKNSIVAVGWSKINFSKYDRTETNELRKAVEQEYYSSESLHAPLVGKKLNEVVRFHKIKTGDFLIIPYYNSIRLAIASTKLLYDSESIKWDLANQRKVKYLMIGNEFKAIPRDSLSEGLQRRLRVRGSSVSDLYEFKDEIEKVFSKENYSWTSEQQERVKNHIETVKEQLFKNIQNGTTNLSTGGIGFELLIKKLFECEGYTANVLAKSTFEGYGDADIYAVKSDKFQETKVLIQVKHHSGYTNNWGIEQLKSIQSDNTYQDYKFVLVTSALISEEVKEMANNIDIETIDGKELIEWLFEHLDHLNDEIRTKLGLTNVPQIF